MTVELSYVENNTLPAIECVYTDSDGEPIDITSYVFKLYIDYGGEIVVINGTIVEAAEGSFIFNFVVGDIRKGKSNAEIEIDDGAGGVLTYQGIKFDVKASIASRVP